ncbi:MAG TPA: glycosyltransferase family 1 protein [Acidobacteriota bacterium]|nr:glycosyltransferase family 1 protein [Acidobacteriota bacterium]
MLETIVIGKKNNFGLTKDSDLLVRAMQAENLGGPIQIVRPHDRSLVNRVLGRRWAKTAIHLERAFPAWFSAADLQILIPNQERFPHRHIRRLKNIGQVLCKSRYAVEIFQHYGVKTEYLGFTSEDRSDRSVEKDWNGILHLAGGSTLKGTEDILTLWNLHPEWPVLHLIQKDALAPKTVPPNVDLITRYLPDRELRTMQNRNGIHLCPSRGEGWGHHIVEGMSTGCLVLSVDAPPMNEHVDASTGLLVPYVRTEPRHLGTCFFPDLSALEAQIAHAIAMPHEEKARFGRAARLAFERIDREFSGRLKRFFDSLR